MGIQGLIPFVKDATEQIHIKKYAGYTVAVDTYCWLHKGAFACAMQLAKGEPTDQYVRYCMKFVNMLRSFNIKPILVFDGCNLPSKKHVENSRRERRQTFMKKGKQFLREGKVNEARDCFTKSINVTSEMALEVMQAARSLGVDCIVAPYEADAQLAYLNKQGIAQAIITEDSDLVAFGCDKVVVKMDINGNGLEISKERLDKAMKIGSKYTMDKFRYMCIISGCDYLPSLPGIGLGKARKLFLLTSNPDVNQFLKKMPMHLKMKLDVGDEYINGFHQANNTFLYQLSFDPLTRKLVPLTPYPPEIQPTDISYAGKYIDDGVALQMALGNVNVNTGRKIAHYVPQTNKSFDPKTPRHLLSIWHNKYKPGPKYGTSDPLKVKQASTKNKQISVKTPAFKTKEGKHKEDNLSFESERDLALMYGSPSKFKKSIVVPETPEKNLEETPVIKPKQQPKIRRNRFAIQRLSSKERTDLINQGATQNSRFFSAEPTKPNLSCSEDESDDSKNNSILLTELAELTQDDQHDDIPECNISAQSRLKKFKRSSPLTSDTNVLRGSRAVKEESSTSNKSVVDESNSELKVKNELFSQSTKRLPSSTGAFSWKKKNVKNEGKSESRKQYSGQRSNSSIKSFLSSFRRNSDKDLKTPDADSDEQKDEMDVIDLTSDLSQKSFKLSQISDLYSIDGDAVSLTSSQDLTSSQSQQNLTQSQQNLTQSQQNLTQSQQNFTQPSQSQQNLTQPSQSQQNLTLLSQSQQNSTQLSQSQQNLTQPSQSQQNLTQPSQSQQNSTQLSQLQQNLTQLSQSQQQNSSQRIQSQPNMTYSTQSQQNLHMSDVDLSQENNAAFRCTPTPASEPRLPEFNLSNLSVVGGGTNRRLKLTNESVNCVTSSYFSNKNNDSGDGTLASSSSSATIKPNKVRCGLRQVSSAPTTPVTSLGFSSHIGPSKNVGLNRRNSKKRKASDENSTRQIKMTKFFTNTNKMSSECSDKLKTKVPLSPVNSTPESTPESEASLRLIEGARVQRNIFN